MIYLNDTFIFTTNQYFNNVYHLSLNNYLKFYNQSTIGFYGGTNVILGLKLI